MVAVLLMTWRLLNDMMCFEEFKIQILLRHQVKCWTIHSHTYTLVITQVKLHQHTHTHGMPPSLLQHPPWIIHQVQRWQTAIRSNLPSFKKKKINTGECSFQYWHKPTQTLVTPTSSEVRRDETKRGSRRSAGRIFCGWEEKNIKPE